MQLNRALSSSRTCSSRTHHSLRVSRAARPRTPTCASVTASEVRAELQQANAELLSAHSRMQEALQQASGARGLDESTTSGPITLQPAPPPPRLVRADIATCFQIQAHVAALALDNNPDNSPYYHHTPHGQVRFIPTPNAKGGNLTFPAFRESPQAFLDRVSDSMGL